MAEEQNPQYRIEKDSMGELEVPTEALYSAQTQRAINNFQISGSAMPESFVRSLITIKSCAAQANGALNLMPPDMAEAIVKACQQLLADEDVMQHFPVDVFQTGSGTSSNMNANEVIATLATRLYGKEVHPNDHVNLGQSSNDVIPTCIHMSATLSINQHLQPALYHLIHQIELKAYQVDEHVKTGRTHLMDAMPVRLSQTLRCWCDQMKLNLSNIQHCLQNTRVLAQGGTAVGTGVNAHPQFSEVFCQKISQETGQMFKGADNFFSLISSQDTMVSLSGHLKTIAVSLMKISNDLRWMNSGPLAGLGEIELEALQPGSSIMPGKVNPVIPEATAMVAAQVIGNDTAITMGGQSGNFELNVMLPLIANNILQNIQLLSKALTVLADKAIRTFIVREDNITASLSKNPILVTALNPIIGYQKAAEIAKKAYREKRAILEVALEETDLPKEKLEELLDPRKLTGE